MKLINQLNKMQANLNFSFNDNSSENTDIFLADIFDYTTGPSRQSCSTLYACRAVKALTKLNPLFMIPELDPWRL